MRKVQVFKTEFIEHQVVRVPDGEAMFHAFGSKPEFGPSMMWTEPVAIIERQDGSVHMVNPCLIQFCEPA